MGLAKLFSAVASPIMDLVSMNAEKKAADRAYKREVALSDTAHQREVADLRAAGLNPILSAGGGGASTPNVAAAKVPDLSAGVRGGISNAIAVQQGMENARYTKQAADRASVESQMMGDMFKYYQGSDESVKQAVRGAMLAEFSGLGKIGSAAGAAAAGVGSAAKRAWNWLTESKPSSSAVDVSKKNPTEEEMQKIHPSKGDFYKWYDSWKQDILKRPGGFQFYGP